LFKETKEINETKEFKETNKKQLKSIERAGDDTALSRDIVSRMGPSTAAGPS